jgi:NADH dehydrogenase
VVADWTLAAVFRREVISLGQLQDPRREFVEAANTGRAGSLPPPTPEDRAQSGSAKAG